MPSSLSERNRRTSNGMSTRKRHEYKSLRVASSLRRIGTYYHCVSIRLHRTQHPLPPCPPSFPYPRSSLSPLSRGAPPPPFRPPSPPSFPSPAEQRRRKGAPLTAGLPHPFAQAPRPPPLPISTRLYHDANTRLCRRLSFEIYLLRVYRKCSNVLRGSEKGRGTVHPRYTHAVNPPQV